MVKVYLVNQCFDVPREGTFTQLANAFSSKRKADNFVREQEFWASRSEPDGYYYVIEEVEVH